MGADYKLFWTQLSFVLEDIRVELLYTARAKAVREGRSYVAAYVALDLLPVSAVILDPLAGRADGHNRAELRKLTFKRGLKEAQVPKHP